MAQIRTVRLVDDLSGDDADETIHFGLDGKRYEIDLSTSNAAALREVLTDYLSAARRAPTGTRPSPRQTSTAMQATGRRRGGTAADRDQNQAIRDWANRRGMQVAERGRIPSKVVTAYHDAHS